MLTINELTARLERIEVQLKNLSKERTRLRVQKNRYKKLLEALLVMREDNFDESD